jgi:hypothetical protein
VNVLDDLREMAGRGPPGVTFVDAPVSGSKGPAEQGQLPYPAKCQTTRASTAAYADQAWLSRITAGSSY